MFSGLMIGFIAGLSAATWIYTQVMRRTGNNTQQSAITAGIAGVAVFFVFWSLIVITDQILG